jgi:MFS family permease
VDGIDKSFVRIAEALILVTLGAAFASVPGAVGEELGVSLMGMPPNPSAELLRGIAGLGGALVIAYVVQAAWLVREAKPAEDRDGWAGFVTGIGIAGFVGVLLALVLAEHRAAGHDNFLDRIGCAWAALALLMLATIVLLHPLLAYRLIRERDKVDGAA